MQRTRLCLSTHKEVNIISVFRDYYVHLPGHFLMVVDGSLPDVSWVSARHSAYDNVGAAPLRQAWAETSQM